MINWIWLFLIVIGSLFAFARGTPEIITQAAFNSAQAAVKYSLELIGVMSFWLGMMKIAEEAGLVQGLARLLNPLLRRLFPSVPPQHPALGAILLNISANILGLSNAATPFGLKAMEELQSLNQDRSVASEAMCTFLALNTACVTLVPTMIIGIRLSAGSRDPTEIIGTTLFATASGMLVAIVADKILQKVSRGGGGRP